MAETTAAKVADFIIGFSQEHGDPVTNLKLQKLLYYAQAWYLAIFDKPLFEEEFQAWVHGPVQVDTYNRFKDARWSPIVASVPQPDFSAEVKDHLLQLMEVYGVEGAYALERMTHQEYPWKNARGNLEPDEPSRAIITKESMKTFYREMGRDDDKHEERKDS